MTLKNPDDYQVMLHVASVLDEMLDHDPRFATTNDVEVIYGDWNPDFWLTRYFPNEHELQKLYDSGRSIYEIII